MPLHVITGPANTGKTQVAHERLIAHVRDGGRATLLLPSEPDVSRALEEFEADAPVGLGVSTFDGYLNGLWASSGDGRAIITPAQRWARLAEYVSEQLSGTDAELLSSPGVVNVLAALVQRAAESPMELPEPIRGRGAAQELLRRAAAYSASLRAAGLIERAEAHRRVCELSGSLELPDLLTVSQFTGFTAAQECFLTVVSQSCEVLVCLTYDPAVPATAAAECLIRRLESQGTVEHRGCEDSTTSEPELRRVERTLGTQGSPEVQAAGAIRLSEAWGETAEAARVVREVQDAIAYGIAPGQIAIVFRDVAQHMFELRLALEEAGIPAEFDARIPFHLTGMGRVLLTLLEMAGEGPEHSRLMDVLRSPFSPTDDGSLDALDAEVRSRRAGGLALVERWARRNHPETGRLLRRARSLCADAVGADAERGWYLLLSDMLRHARCGEAAVDSEVLADAAAARAFLEAVRGIGALPGHVGGPDSLASALRETRVSVASGDREGCVQVMGMERVRGRRYDCVIVGGLTAKEVPRRTGEEALCAPSVAECFHRFGIDVAPRGGTDEERLLFYQATTRAARRLVLSAQSHDSQGRPVRPSLFLEEVLDLYRDPVSGQFFNGEPPKQTLGLDGLSCDPAAPLSRSRALRCSASEMEGLESDVGDELREVRRRASRKAPPCSEGVRRVTAEREVFSASEIETYLQCPFRWYTQYVIQPRELDERLNAAAVGRHAHEIMWRFYELWEPMTGGRRVVPQLLGTARDVHGEAVEAAREGIHVLTAREDSAIRLAAKQTLSLVEADADFLPGFEPAYREWSFGIVEGDPPEPFGDFGLAGRVDRIDVDERRLFVIDYKLGTVDQKRGVTAFESEGLVQLPLYAAAASRRLGLEIAGGAYRPIGESKPRGFVREDLRSPTFVGNDVVGFAEAEDVIKAAIGRAAQAVEGLRSGNIAACPRGGKCPPYCPAIAFCAEWRPGRG